MPRDIDYSKGLKRSIRTYKLDQLKNIAKQHGIVVASGSTKRDVYKLVEKKLPKIPVLSEENFTKKELQHISGQKNMSKKNLFSRTKRSIRQSQKDIINMRKKKKFSTLFTGRPNYEAKRYCSCIKNVAEKQSEECLRNTATKKRTKKRCYNPYAICTSSIKRREKIDCYRYYKKITPKLQILHKKQ